MKPVSSLMIFFLTFYLVSISLSGVVPKLQFTDKESSVEPSYNLDSNTTEDTSINTTESLYDGSSTNKSEVTDSIHEVTSTESNNSGIPEVVIKVTLSKLSKTKSTSYAQIVTDSKPLESDTKSTSLSALQSKKQDDFIDSTPSTALYPEKSTSSLIIKDKLTSLIQNKMDYQDIPSSISKVSSDEKLQKKGYLINKVFSTKPYSSHLKQPTTKKLFQEVDVKNTFTTPSTNSKYASSSSSTRISTAPSTTSTRLPANIVHRDNKIASTTLKPLGLKINLPSRQEIKFTNLKKTTVKSLIRTENKVELRLKISVDLIDEVSNQAKFILSKFSTKKYKFSLNSEPAPLMSSTRASTNTVARLTYTDTTSNQLVVPTIKPLGLKINLPSHQEKKYVNSRKTTVPSLTSKEDKEDEVKVPFAIRVILIDEVSNQDMSVSNGFSTKRYKVNLEQAHMNTLLENIKRKSTSAQIPPSSSTRASTQTAESQAYSDTILNPVAVPTMKPLELKVLKEKITKYTIFQKILPKHEPRKELPHISTQTTAQSTTLLTTTQPAQWKIRNSSTRSDLFDEVCKLDRDTGSGSDGFSSWYFNYNNGRCEWFSYLGDGGNGNRFNHRANCEHSCIEKYENICERIDIVYCEENWLRCKMEIDRECQQNAKFYNRDEFLFCPPKQPLCVRDNIRKPPIYLTHRSIIPQNCLLPPDQGYCGTDNNSLLVYYYDSKLNDCMGMLYTNCGGNSNRFPSKSECMNRCAI